jgi:hypothetical protein
MSTDNDNNDQASVSLIGHIRIRDPDTGETILRQRDLNVPPTRALDATYHEPIPATPQEYWRGLVDDYAAHLHAAYARERATAEKSSQDDR